MFDIYTDANADTSSSVDVQDTPETSEENIEYREPDLVPDREQASWFPFSALHRYTLVLQFGLIKDAKETIHIPAATRNWASCTS